MFGEVADLVNITKSGAMIYATNLKIKHEEIVLVEGNKYTLTFKYSNTAGNQFIFKIKNTTEITLVNTTEAKNLEEVTYTFVASGNITYSMECVYLDNTKGGFISDLILIDGDLRSNWEPAPRRNNGNSITTILQWIKSCIRKFKYYNNNKQFRYVSSR